MCRGYRNIVLMLGVLWSMSVGAVRFSEEAKRNSQLVDSVNRTVTLVFCIDTAHYNVPIDSIISVYAWGSVSEYKEKIDSCRMTAFSEDSCYYITFTYDQFARPGDSGQPEFAFCVEWIDSTTWNYLPDTVGPNAMDKRLLFINGLPSILVVLPGGPRYMTTNLDTLYERSLLARVFKPLSEFDLTDSVDQHRISNFRLTAGTKNLYRSYHPYYPSMRICDSEIERLKWVQNLSEQVGIKSDISLTGSLAYTVGEKCVCAGDTHIITMPPYYQALIDAGHVCDLNISSSQCYYHADEKLFAELMKQVVEFIIDERHPMPMQIHCAIGADRTGVVCAVISALCGAEWTNIMADYAATSDMMVQTYRHPNRLRYALGKMTGLDMDSCTSVECADAIRAHLVDKMQVLTNDQIDRMVARLQLSTPTDSEQTNIHSISEKYDLLGRPVGDHYRGLSIQNGALIMRP